jgi:hypothetical protein
MLGKASSYYIVDDLSKEILEKLDKNFGFYTS